MRPHPPALARWIASTLLRGDAREIVVGDLDEAFARRIASGTSARAAARLYWHDALASVGAVWGDRVHVARSGGARARPRVWQGVGLDLRYVVRGLAASRGFTAVAILSLAIGIGATTALANVARTLLITELPVERPGDLSWVFWSADLQMRATNFGSDGIRTEGQSYITNFSFPLYRAIQATAPDGAEVTGFNILPRVNVARPGQPPAVAAGLIVAGDFFHVVRLAVSRGRPLVDADDRDGAAPVVVITDAFWRRLYARDPAAVGSVLAINGTPFEIVGIVAAPFDGLSRGGIAPATEIIVPMAAQPVVAPSWKGDSAPLREDFTRQWIRILARGRADASTRLASTAAAALAQTLTPVVPRDPGLRTIAVRLWPANRGIDSFRDGSKQPLTILTAVVGIFLLVTCINLAGLLTARGLARRRELAVRRALGAERWRLIRQALVESVVLAGAGGSAGVLLAAWCAPALTAMLSDGLNANDVRLPIDGVLIFIAGGVTLATALIFGGMPAVRLTRAQSTTELRNRATPGSYRQRGGGALIAIQLAVTIPLVVGALLFLRTLHNFSTVDLGFEPQGLALFEINPVRSRSLLDAAPPSLEDASRMRAVLARLEAIPGVASATVVENALLTGWSSNTEIYVDGQRARMQMQAVGPRFFETMQMRMVAGRPITGSDLGGAAPVAVINETAARRHFGGGSPIGRTFRVGSGRTTTRTLEVVGVVADARYESLRNATAPTFYDSYMQRPGGTYTTFFAVRTMVPALSLERSIKDAVAAVDPGLPIVRLETQQQKIDRALGRERVLSRLLTLFGAFALLLASLGLHGLTSYAVARRTSEIGIRLALGAQRSQVLWLILRQVLWLAVAGVALGLPLAWAGGPLVGAYLYGVAPRDAWTIAMSACVLTAVAMLAGWMPARRAARMDPLGALRVE